jgi:hypothetical protein
MKTKQILALKLKEFSRRYHFLRTGKCLINWFLCTLSAYLALLLFDKFVSLPSAWPLFFFVFCGLGIAIYLILDRQQRVSFFWLASQIDKKLGLEERVSTAWEYQSRKRPKELIQFLTKDALCRLQGVRTSQVFPCRWFERGKYVIYLLIGISLVSFSSYFLPFPPRGKIDFPDLFQEEGQLLMNLGQKLIRRGEDNLERASLLALEMRELGKDIYYKNLEEEQIFQAYHQLSQEIAAALKKTAASLLGKLKGLREEKGGAIDENRLSKLIEALEKEDYQGVNHLLQQYPLQEQIDEIGELQALQMMEKTLGKSYQRSKEELGKKESDQEPWGAIPGKEMNSPPAENGKDDGYSSAEEKERDFLADLGLATGSLPGNTSSNYKKEEIIELEEKGELSKVESQLKQGYFFMRLLQGIADTSDKSGLSAEEAFFSYKKEMMNRLTEERIPLSYKEQIKKYFSSLEPE